MIAADSTPCRLLVGRQSETTQVICWDRGRPARNAPQARRLCTLLTQSLSRFALIAGGTPAVPANHLEWFQMQSQDF
jgi:hypothetical protein